MGQTQWHNISKNLFSSLASEFWHLLRKSALIFSKWLKILNILLSDLFPIRVYNVYCSDDFFFLLVDAKFLRTLSCAGVTHLWLITNSVPQKSVSNVAYKELENKCDQKLSTIIQKTLVYCVYLCLHDLSRWAVLLIIP